MSRTQFQEDASWYVAKNDDEAVDPTAGVVVEHEIHGLEALADTEQQRERVGASEHENVRVVEKPGVEGKKHTTRDSVTTPVVVAKLVVAEALRVAVRAVEIQVLVLRCLCASRLKQSRLATT